MNYFLKKPQGFVAWLIFALGMLLVLIGLTLVIGGTVLIAAGGSYYYLLAGIGVTAAGWLLGLRMRLGAIVYTVTFAATVIWAFWEVGPDGWALVPRVFVPAVLFMAVLATSNALHPFRPWRRFIFASVAGFAIITAIVVTLVIRAGQVITYDAAAPGSATSYAPIASASSAEIDWPAYGGTYAAQRFSALAQINRDNVRKLKRAWEYRTGDLPDKRWGAETTPLKIGDALYLCSARNVIIALDARTGEERWRHDPKVSDKSIPYTAACRGVTYFERQASLPDTQNMGSQACAARVIEGTLDGRLIAVDARTGRPCVDFGDNGQVDITRGMGETAPGMVSITSPPVVVRGVIVTGHQVLDGQKRYAPSGVIKGYDAITGQLKWAWDLARPDIKGMPPEGETYTRGTPNMWTIATADEALGFVYLPMGNSAADYYSSTRSEAENQFSTSLVALDVTTGDPVWRFQTVHVDVWDYDLGSQGTLVDFPVDGGTVPAIVLPSKQGDMYVLDRRTGKPLTGVAERPVPAGGVEPQERSPTQPFSSYHSLRKPDLAERDMWGFSPIDQMICRIQFKRAAYSGIYTPPTVEQRWIQYPGYNGGSDWGGIAVDPREGVIVANYNDMPNYNRLVTREESNRRGWQPRGSEDDSPREGGPEGAGDPQIGVPYAVDVNAGWRMPVTGLLCKQPPYGGIRAIDLKSGKTLWDRPLGTARSNGPFRIPSRLPLNIGTPNNGGPVVTAGGVIFIAAATDNLIRAIDLRTGQTLWRDVLPAGGQATPMTYEVDGRQYMVIMAGGHHFMETPIGDHVIAYALEE